MKIIPWLCCVLLAASALAKDPADKYDMGEEIFDGAPLDQLAMTYQMRIHVETLRYISKNGSRRAERDSLETSRRLEVLAALVESHNGPPRLVAALQTLLPHARVTVNAAGDILLQDRNPAMDQYSPMGHAVAIKSFTGNLSALLKSLSAQGVDASLMLAFSIPSLRKEFPMDPEVTIQDFHGTFRDLLLSIISKQAKDTRYHLRTTVNTDTQEVSTQITLNYNLANLKVAELPQMRGDLKIGNGAVRK